MTEFHMTKAHKLAALVILLAVCLAVGVPAGELSESLRANISGKSADEFVSVWIRMETDFQPGQLKHEVAATAMTRAGRNRLTIERLKAAAGYQDALLSDLYEREAAGAVREVKGHWIAPVVEAQMRVSELEAVAKHPDVRAIYAIPALNAIQPETYGTAWGSKSPADVTVVQSNLTHVNAPAAWAAGYTGAGRLVCNFDTGVLGSHPALSQRWNGRNADSAASWFDPIDGLKYPHLISAAGGARNHGTHSMGIICGADPAGDTVGVAPGAKWMAAAVIDIAGASILDAFEWACDPDGDPNTIADVPDVINHSWGYDKIDCVDVFYTAIDNCEAAGIVNIMAAGNSGSAAQSVLNPAAQAVDSIDNFAVGNLNHRTNTIVGSSSRGPSPCDLTKFKPNVVAPGDSITSTWGDGGYDNLGGTSMAAPHVAGLVALLRQKNPDATVDEIKLAILNSTKRSGFGIIPNNTYGWGEIDCLAAINALSGPSVQSVRVADFRHDAISPGDTVRGTILLQNKGTAASNVSLTISGSNGALNVLDNSATFGSIPGQDTVRSVDSVVAVVSDTVTPGLVLPIDVMINGDGFSTPGKLYFLVEPPGVKTFVTHNEGRIRFTVSNFGGFGLGPDESWSMFPLGGEGFTFDLGDNDLWEGGLILGNGFTRVSSCVHSYLFDPDMDFAVAPSGNLQFTTTSSVAAQETFCIFEDSRSRTPLGLEITQQTYAFSPPNDDFIVMSYILKNTSDSTIHSLYLGLFMDWDLVSYSSNCGGNESVDGFAWMAYNNGATKSYYRGIKLIGETPATAGAVPSSEIYPPVAQSPNDGPGFPTLEKYRVLTSGTQYAEQNKNAQKDLYMIVSAGPMVLVPGGKDTVAFAVLAGESFVDIHGAAARANFNPTGVEDNPDTPDNLPVGFRLYQNYPNPFNPATTISFDLPVRSDYRLSVMNVLGQTVFETTGNVPAGRVDVVWNGENEASGVYLYRVTAGDYTASRKMLLLK